MRPEFWKGRRVFITGHTGFKGSWLSACLQRAGALVTGYALDPPTSPSLFQDGAFGQGMECITGDVRELSALKHALLKAAPEVVFHLAAQSLVLASYRDPVETFATNVMGTVNLLEAVRALPAGPTVINVTSDKCYENREWVWPYRESDRLGGRDPYSASKACAELVAHSFRNSFFDRGGVRLYSVRAGNVIGGGDWAANRLVPDLVRAFRERTSASIRNPASTRPWQFVLDPLNGYMMVAEASMAGEEIPAEWNFGPDARDWKPVSFLADRAVAQWGDGVRWEHAPEATAPREAFTLALDSTRSRRVLGWRPHVDLETGLRWTIEWYRSWSADPDSARSLTLDQVDRFLELASA